MDIGLARTFLEVIGAGSFVGAAQRLNVTQSTVSMRIRLLEEQLGSRLFVRKKGGAVLTAAGAQFQRPATTLVRIWEQARQDAVLPDGYSAVLRIGGKAGLWNRWLHRWVPWMRNHARDIALRCEVGLADDLTRGLMEGLLDIAVMYSPKSRSSLKIELLVEEELVLLEADQPERAGGARDLVYVDWGEEFRHQHRMTFPDFPSPALFIGLGTLGFDYLVRSGGTGYFPKGLAQPHLASGRVRVVPGASTFQLPVYAVYPIDAESRAVELGLAGLRAVVADEPGEPAEPSMNPPAKKQSRRAPTMRDGRKPGKGTA
jgi:LysR family transcriptional regulator, flagellar master operon regulator